MSTRKPPSFRRKSVFRKAHRIQWILAALALVLLSTPIVSWQLGLSRHLSSGSINKALLLLGACAAVASGVFPLLLGMVVLLITAAGVAGFAIYGVGFLRHPTLSRVGSTRILQKSILRLITAGAGDALRSIPNLSPSTFSRHLVTSGPIKCIASAEALPRMAPPRTSVG